MSGSTPPDGRPWSEQPAWRLDFPIDWPRDHYVQRREFLKFLCLTSLGFTVGQACLVVDSFLRPPRTTASVPIARVNELAVGDSRLFHYPTEGDPCLLIRVEPERFVAFGQKCTHLACAVVPQVDRKRLYCPCHAGAFDLDSGRPLFGPPRRPLPRITLEVREDTVYATGVELRS